MHLQSKLNDISCIFCAKPFVFIITMLMLNRVGTIFKPLNYCVYRKTTIIPNNWKDMKYLLVGFEDHEIDEVSLSVVATLWMSKDGTKCWYPTDDLESYQIAKLVRRQEEPTNCYKQYNIRIIYDSSGWFFNKNIFSKFANKYSLHFVTIFFIDVVTIVFFFLF